MTNRETIPMKSVKAGPGRYEVLGTSHHVEIARVLDGDLRPQYAWHLIVDGEWWQTFPTKRAALQACQRSVEL